MKTARILQLAITYASLAIAVVSTCLLGAAEPSGEHDQVFLGYVHRMPEDINYDLYTHLCHAFVVADENGTLAPNKSVPSRELIRDAHKAGVQVLLSLGGWGWDQQFAAMTTDEPAEARYVAAVMKLVDDFDYDGVDLDWEYPDSATEVVGFERLCRQFRARLDELGKQKRRPLLLTMAASASPSTLKWLRSEFLLETMDWINVMTYDYAGDWSTFAGHHSPLFASSKAPVGSAVSTELTMKYLVDRGVPKSRLVVGLPLYGRGFSVGEPYADTTGAPPPGRATADYAHLHELKGKHGWVRRWDDETKNPWLVNPDGPGVIGYDDEESLSIKARWAREQGFRGVFFWQIAGDRLPAGGNPLQEAASKAWTQAVDEPDR